MIHVRVLHLLQTNDRAYEVEIHVPEEVLVGGMPPGRVLDARAFIRDVTPNQPSDAPPEAKTSAAEKPPKPKG